MPQGGVGGSTAPGVSHPPPGPVGHLGRAVIMAMARIQENVAAAGTP